MKIKDVHWLMHNFSQASSTWSIKIYKDDQLTLMRIARNSDREHEAVESSKINFNQHASSVIVTQSFPDCIILDAS